MSLPVVTYPRQDTLPADREGRMIDTYKEFHCIMRFGREIYIRDLSHIHSLYICVSGFGKAAMSLLMYRLSRAKLINSNTVVEFNGSSAFRVLSKSLLNSFVHLNSYISVVKDSFIHTDLPGAVVVTTYIHKIDGTTPSGKYFVFFRGNQDMNAIITSRAPMYNARVKSILCGAMNISLVDIVLEYINITDFESWLQAAIDLHSTD